MLPWTIFLVIVLSDGCLNLIQKDISMSHYSTLPTQIS